MRIQAEKVEKDSVILFHPKKNLFSTDLWKMNNPRFQKSFFFQYRYTAKLLIYEKIWRIIIQDIDKMILNWLFIIGLFEFLIYLWNLIVINKKLETAGKILCLKKIIELYFWNPLHIIVCNIQLKILHEFWTAVSSQKSSTANGNSNLKRK